MLQVTTARTAYYSSLI